VKTTIRVTYLEMQSPAALRPGRRVPPDLLLLRAGVPSPELGRFLYTAVGGDWYWQERLPWTWQQWKDWLARPEVETWVGYERGTPAGYFELVDQGASGVQLTYFGLMPGFTGRGLGGHLLTQAVDRAWQRRPGVERVWVHTCSLDHAAALPNYLARGFTVYRVEEHSVELPDLPPGPWAGAERPR
jgi:GNAT superfamily N-acetyltransferase